MPSVRKVNEVKREAADSELCSPEHLRSARSLRAKINIKEL